MGGMLKPKNKQNDNLIHVMLKLFSTRTTWAAQSYTILAQALHSCTGHKHAAKHVGSMVLGWSMQQRQCLGTGATVSSDGIAWSAQGLCEGVPEVFRGRSGWRWGL